MEKKICDKLRNFSRLNFYMFEKIGPAYQRVDERDKLLNKNQIRAVMVVGNRDQVTSSALGCMLHMKKGSVTTLIDGLVEKGLVMRQPDENDRRKIWIRLTESGLDYYKDNYAQLDVEIYKIINQLPEEEQEELFEGLEQVIKILKKL